MRSHSLGAVFTAFLLGAFAPTQAACVKPNIVPARQVRLSGDSLMIVTHPSSTFDARLTSKRGIDDAVAHIKGLDIPAVYLIDDSPARAYFPADCAPDYWVSSQDGEVEFSVAAKHLYIAGGHLEMCMSRTLNDVFYQWSKKPLENRTVTFFMDAIYSNGKSVEEGDPFYSDFQKFMGVITYGRPGGEHWPKLNLLEMMGVIIKEEHEYKFLEKVLPRWDRTFPQDYRVELKLNDGAARVLRKGAGLFAPKLLFHFVDSAPDNIRIVPRGVEEK